MKQLYLKTIFVITAFVLAVFFIVIILLRNPQQPATTSSISSSTTTVSTTSIVAQQTPQRINGAKVPDGWYTHQTYGMENERTVLSRTKDLPNTPSVEQIGISDMTTSLTPEDFASHQGAGIPVDSPDVQSSWGIYQGHKTLSVTSTAGGVAQWLVYVFGGQTVYEFALSPNDQTNSNLAQDRTDFWKVITYYTQDSSFEKLSREETQQNCKTFTVPSGQEPTIQAEPETGYVVVAFTKDGKKNYTFLNFNDNLSLCAPNAQQLLLNTKDEMSKRSALVQ